MKHLLYFTKKLHAYAGPILYVNVFGMMIISLLDGIGILLLVPLLGISGLIDMNASSIPLLNGLSILKQLPMEIALMTVLGAYLLIVAGQALIQRRLSLRDVRIHTGFISHVRLETYEALMRANWSYFIRKRKSDLVNSMTEELGRVMNGTYVFLQFMASAVFTFIQIGIAFWLSAEMTLFVLGCGLVIAFFSRTFIRKSRQLGSQTSELARSYMGEMTDQFNGIKDIKSNMLESSRIEWLREWNRQVGQERYDYVRLSSNSRLYYKMASTILIAAFIYASITLFQTQGQQLLLIIMIFSRLWPRFTGLQSNLEQIAASMPAFSSLVQLQQECREAREIERPEAKVQPLRMEEGLECREIYYRYQKNEPRYALQNIGLYIRSRQMTAFVGRSGAGKSTLIDMVMGLLQPESGQVLIDGVPLTSGNLLSFRQSIGYVPQDPLLFHGSIRDNLLMIQPGSSEEQLWEALEFAAAAEFVAKLPKGLDTWIGDRGVRLSGGERQRLVLARAILRKPAILVLDEATSALDAENEAKIQDALSRIKGKMTLIVIAHRLSTIRNADQVIVLDQGRIVQHGGFHQLAKEKGQLFASLLGNQMQDSTVISAT